MEDVIGSSLDFRYFFPCSCPLERMRKQSDFKLGICAVHLNQVWQHMTAVAALNRLGMEEYVFEARLGCIMSLCLK